MGKKQDSMENETAICYGVIPEILDLILVGCSEYAEIMGKLSNEVDVRKVRKLAIREHGCAMRESEEWRAVRVARVDVEVCEEKAT